MLLRGNGAESSLVVERTAAEQASALATDAGSEKSDDPGEDAEHDEDYDHNEPHLEGFFALGVRGALVVDAAI